MDGRGHGTHSLSHSYKGQSHGFCDGKGTQIMAEGARLMFFRKPANMAEWVCLSKDQFTLNQTGVQ